ncbi:MAG TPA: hypothetical protein PK819_02420 [Thermomicrobiales bacterium]|nr:hypothetical protein [Thermomicrobiales bacterium]
MSTPKRDDYRQVDIPLVRAKDKVPVGNLKLIRTQTWVLYDENGQRLAVPKHQDTLIVALARASGEQIVWTQMPFAELLGEP